MSVPQMIINHLLYIHNINNHIHFVIRSGVFTFKKASRDYWFLSCLWNKQETFFCLQSYQQLFFLKSFLAIICLTKFTYFTTQKKSPISSILFFSHAYVNILKWMRQQSKKVVSAYESFVEDGSYYNGSWQGIYRLS